MLADTAPLGTNDVLARISLRYGKPIVLDFTSDIPISEGRKLIRKFAMR